jgi:hypothetical protein
MLTMSSGLHIIIIIIIGFYVASIRIILYHELRFTQIQTYTIIIYYNYYFLFLIALPDPPRVLFHKPAFFAPKTRSLAPTRHKAQA